MKAVGYIRVSTEGQAVEGVSLEAQKARIEAWALANAYDLLNVHIDAGISGSRAENRPGLQTAIAQACTERAALVVYSLSRLARSTKDTLAIGERLDRAGADLVSLSERIDTTTAAGKMVFRMLAVLAEFERDQISERTKTAMGHLKAQGKRVGAVPFGYDLAADGETLTRNDGEQKSLTRILTLKAEGWSLRKIAVALESEGFKAKQGGRWTPEALRLIIKREAAA